MKYVYIVCIFLTFHLVAFGQTRNVTGVVRETSGETLPGVTVQVEGTTRGTATDINGEFTISVSSGESLVFSSVGKKPAKEVVGARNVINVTLFDEETKLGEVVITAFGEAKRANVASSIESVRVSDLRVPSSNLTSAFAGRIAGLISFQTTGEPGADNAQFFVRGIGSFGQGKSEPLILIDGFESTSDELARLRPDDIESFSVLKDAAAAVMYGARSANGIITVKTKSGFEGKTRISARVDVNFAMPTQRIDFLDGVRYMRMYNEATLGRDPNAPLVYTEQKIQATARGDNPMIYPNIKWYDALMNKYTMNQRANLSVSGGGQVATYYVAGGFDHETGLLKVDKRNNFNNNISINRAHLRSNVIFKLSKTTTLDTRINGRFERYTGPYASATEIFSNVMASNPVDFPFVYEPDAARMDAEHILFGSIMLPDGSNKTNPYALMVRGYEDRAESNITMQATLSQNLEFITPGLKASFKMAANNWSKYTSRRTYTPFLYSLDNYDIITGEHKLFPLNPTQGSNYLGNVIAGRDANSDFYYEGIINWNRIFGKHDLAATVVGLASEKLLTGGNSSSIAETLPEKNMGISGKATYVYDEKYIGELTFGYNGSEKFTGEKQFGFFPAGAVAWFISKESFFEPLKPIVSSLKLKASLGKGGNDNITGSTKGRFFFMSGITMGGYQYRWGEQFLTVYDGYRVSQYANPNITWESNLDYDFGIELGLFKDEALKIHFDVFRQIRSNIYLERENFPKSTGLEAPISGNVGKLQKDGFDGSINYTYEFSNHFWLQGRGTITYSKNKYLQLDEKDYPDKYRKRKGQARDQQFGFLAERLFVDEQEIVNSPWQPLFSGGGYLAGDIKYKDINGDGVVNEKDQIPIGFPTSAQMQYGFGLSAGYKNFDLSFYFQGNAQVSLFIDPGAGWNQERTVANGIAPFVDRRAALPLVANDYWSETNPNPHAFYPRLSTSLIANNTVRSTWWMRDGSFLRLKSAELGYNITTGLDKLHIQLLRFYVSGENLLVLSRFKLWDPEMGGNGLRYPPNRRINFGVKLDF